MRLENLSFRELCFPTPREHLNSTARVFEDQAYIDIDLQLKKLNRCNNQKTFHNSVLVWVSMLTWDFFSGADLQKNIVWNLVPLALQLAQ